MPKRHEEYLSEFSVNEIYSLILNIESYPDFLPWCSAAQIVSQSSNLIIADLVITFKAFTEHYRSEIRFAPPSDGKAKIEVKMISGPFEYLYNIWNLEERDDGTMIKFDIDFKFKSIVLERIIGLVFNKACEKMLIAFINEAKVLYNKTS